MSEQITSSVVIAKALGFDADGVASGKDCHCAFCGIEIKEGDLSIPFAVGPGFMDAASLAAKGSETTCGYCVHVLTANGLRQTGYGVFSSEGKRPFQKWVDVAESIVNPPEPPFVMCYATAKNQHMAWRAPVNYSKELFYVRLGLRDVKIRRKYMLKAIDACRIVAEGMGKKVNKKAKTLPNPFSGISSDLSDISHADLSSVLNRLHQKEEFQHLLDDQKFTAELNHLLGLTLGETWALRFVLTPGAGTPNQ